MNLRLKVAGLDGEWVGLDREGILHDTDGDIARFRKPGFETEKVAEYKDVEGQRRSIGFAFGRIVEIISPANWPGLGNTLRSMRTGERMDPWRLDLFRQCGELRIEPLPQRDADEVICECKAITRSEIVGLLATCTDRAAVGAACGAGTVCGGCVPQIDDLIGHNSMIAAELIATEHLGDGIARFRFRYLAPVTLSVEPGSHLLIQAEIQGRRITRPYTIVAVAPDGCVDIMVKREPGGVLSRWLHDHASSRRAFVVSAPQYRQRLLLRGRVMFIAAGIGITPAFSYMGAPGPDTFHVHWSLRAGDSSPIAAIVRAAVQDTGRSITMRSTAAQGRQSDWGSVCPSEGWDTVILCGPPTFQHAVVTDLVAAGWDRTRIVIENFGARPLPSATLQHVDSFDYLQEPIVADSFHLVPVSSMMREAQAFLRQFYFEHGAPAAFDERWTAVASEIEQTGTYRQTYEELAFGARLAWRNSARCIGRFFWKSLQVRDCRHLTSEEQVFDAIVSHLDDASNSGDIKPIITVFRSGDPAIRILNQQLILYAGYRKPDGSVMGDPKNVALTEIAVGLGWRGAKTRFDILPVMIQIGDASPRAFILPQRVVLEVALTHPRNRAFSELGLRWFAVPAVSGMALDVGGIQYSAAPSNGFYMSTEIGSMNLADPSRYDETERVAQIMGLDTSGGDPLWRDQALLDLNVAVLHSFTKAGVRILDHHSMSNYFTKFRQAEALAERPSYGHWAWIMPPMGGNLSPIWRDNTLKNKILKPNYFYQSQLPTDLAGAKCEKSGRCPISH